jgi:hypothetical protein
MTKITNLKKLVMAALNKCNITVRQLLDMSDEERVQRRIPMEVVTFVKDNLDDTKTTPTVDTEQPVEEVVVVDETQSVATEQPVVVAEEALIEQPADETQIVAAEQPVVAVEEVVVDDVVADDVITPTPALVVEGDVTRAATDDELKLIKETVDGNKAKTFTKQLSGLKAKLGDEFIEGLDQTQIKEIIEARIAELKGE